MAATRGHRHGSPHPSSSPLLLLLLATSSLLALTPPPVAVAVAWYQPAPGTTFYWQLSDSNPNVAGSISTSDPADVYDVDGFEVPAGTIASLKAAGKKVICYFSFGTWERYRPDAKDFPRRVKKGVVCQDPLCRTTWQGERWIDFRDPAVKTIMEKRIQLAASKGCDGIEPDNVDAYDNKVDRRRPSMVFRRMRVTQQDQIAYNSWIADAVHNHSMSVGLKNALAIARQLEPKFDWALVEECNAYSDWSKGAWYKGKFECDGANWFVKAGKAVFVAEYTSEWGAKARKTRGIQFPQALCADNNAHGFSSRLFSLDLGPATFPIGNCLQHRPSGCAAWQQCVLPSVYGPYAQAGKGMTDADKIGQCVRANVGSCGYV